MKRLTITAICEGCGKEAEIEICKEWWRWSIFETEPHSRLERVNYEIEYKLPDGWTSGAVTCCEACHKEKWRQLEAHMSSRHEVTEGASS